MRRVPPDIQKRMKKILYTSLDVWGWWNHPHDFLDGKSPREQFMADEGPVYELIDSYFGDDLDDIQRERDGLDGTR